MFLNFVEIGCDSGGIIIIVIIEYYMSVRILECKKRKSEWWRVTQVFVFFRIMKKVEEKEVK
jgi:hypothetical protein